MRQVVTGRGQQACLGEPVEHSNNILMFMSLRGLYRTCAVMLVNLLGCGLGLLIVGNRVSHLPQNIWSSVEICSEHTFLLTAVLVPQELQFVVTLHLAPSTDRSANAYGAYSIMIKLLSW